MHTVLTSGRMWRMVSKTAMPAVTLPPSLKAPGSFCRPASVVSGRLHSSRSTTTSLCVFSPVALSTTSIVAFIGEISSAARPELWKSAVRFCDCRANSSWLSRLTL